MSQVMDIRCPVFLNNWQVFGGYIRQAYGSYIRPMKTQKSFLFKQQYLTISEP